MGTMTDDYSVERLQGRVVDIVFKSDETGYCVARVKDDEDNLITIVGSMPFLGNGECIDAEGDYVSHPQYGRQFSVRSYQRYMPTDTEGIFEYLASGGIKGIGVKTAQMIVERFGGSAFEVIANEPEKLAKIRGISLEKAYRIQNSFLQAGALRALIEFLAFHRLPAYFASPLLSRFGSDAIDFVTRDPYLLCAEPFGVGFSAADSLASEFGIDQEAAVRLDGALIYELNFNLQNGHVFIPADKLVAVTASLAKVSNDALEERLVYLEEGRKIVRVQNGDIDAVYLACAFRWETVTAEETKRLVKMPVKRPIGLTKKLEKIEKNSALSLVPLQKEAILGCFESGISIITGGPGTGKTTALIAAIELLESCGFTYLLAAPTGRAADRMSKVTERDASTLHRMLESVPDEWGGMSFKRNKSNPLDADVIIVDEASMIDLNMSASLLDALRPHARLVLVGDVDQLPPVGAGRFFKDLLDSGIVPAVRLTEIFRQAQDSDIIMNAHMINKGEMPPLQKNNKDFYFSSNRTAQGASSAVCELIANRIPERFGIDPADVQVICPSRRNTCGTEELNMVLQARLNPPENGKGELQVGKLTFRQGDRVMQTKNNYNRTWQDIQTRELGAGLYNGDTGVIESVDSRGKILTIRFDTKVSEYAFSELGEIEHAFAITAHKSQGSEYRAVIIPIFDCPARLLSRNLLYTAVTRAKELLVIVGREDMTRQMVVNGNPAKRYSALKRRLKNEY
ncbi:MAG: ATP-dependent RecD-like DNA helicase [Clostridia bacterium]|nr:ATP-dependent RecD-like DNA helicase [Clostridia bacterium]